MILRDAYCEQCFSVVRDVEICAVEELLCSECRAMTLHHVVCNGGTKGRYRFNDLPHDPRFYRGMISTSAPTATVAATGEKVADLHGGAPIQERARFSEDARAERQDRRYFATDHKRGTPRFILTRGNDG